jgi:uncharacterized membrane protein (UPF0127 family)
MRQKVLSLAAACAIAAFCLLVYYLTPPMTAPTTLPTAQIHTGSTTILVEVARDRTQEEQGLSGRDSLPEGRGMLFVFEYDGDWGIWMKDMKFPIDILFLSEAGSVVSVNANVPPDSYPRVFYPPLAVRYALELPAGYAQAHGIAAGSVFSLGL